jgi:hypothetical protein
MLPALILLQHITDTRTEKNYQSSDICTKVHKVCQLVSVIWASNLPRTLREERRLKGDEKYVQYFSWKTQKEEIHGETSV